MPTITQLIYQQKNRQRVNVFLDGDFAFGLPEIVAAALKVGQTLNDAEIAHLRAADASERAFDQAVRLLAHRPRSQHELERRWREAGFDGAAQAAALVRLQRLGHVDDRAFVAWWVENRVRFRPRSPQALRQELSAQGIERPLIDEALAEVDAETQALAAGRQQAQRWRTLPQAEFVRKMLAFLQRRGFDYAIAGPVTRRLWQELGETILPGEPEWVDD